MPPGITALLLSWSLRADITVVLSLAGLAYFLGWQRLRPSRRSIPSRKGHERTRFLATRWRLSSYLCGIAAMMFTLMSPIDVLGGHMFFIHMIQHLLLVMVIPPLLLIANPLPFMLWGIPSQIRIYVGRCLSKGSPFRETLTTLTRPGLVWLFFILSFIGWHDPWMYNKALSSKLLHDLEHLTFFGSAMLYWWHITRAGPRIHHHFTDKMRVTYLLATVPANMLAGVAITFASQPLYNYYRSVPRLWGISLMQDQMLGGIIMWIPGSMMYLAAVIIVLARSISVREQKRSLQDTSWNPDEPMGMPGQRS